jgi:hypothetical protein
MTFLFLARILINEILNNESQSNALCQVWPVQSLERSLFEAGQNL